MNWLASVVGVLYAMIGLASGANAQRVSQQVRFVSPGPNGSEQWQGYIERLTPDSLFLRVHGVDTVAAFSRTIVRSIERQRGKNAARAASVGCLTVGGALGALGYFGTHDPDSPGLKKTAGVIGLVVGCGVGAVGGLVVAAVNGREWEPWIPPDQIQ